MKQPSEVFYKNAVLKIWQYSQENNSVGVSFKSSCRITDVHFFQKDTSTQVFSCEYCEISKNTYFEKHILTAASVDCKHFYRATEGQIEMKYK